MEFKFEFSVGEYEGPDYESSRNIRKAGEKDEKATITELDAEELEVSHNLAKPSLNDDSFAWLQCKNNIIIKYRKHLSEVTTESGELTDLIPGVYEGGMKIWECAHVLLEYLAELSESFLADKHVLELGCGSGLPGIYCLLKGAKVHFQDYNKQVLEDFTIPNVVSSCPMDVISRTKFLSGDWSKIAKLLLSTQERFDLILGSEVIYSALSYEKLHDVFASCLKEDGVIF